MIPLGTYSTLTAKRQLLQGIYLEDAEGDEVLLPNKYIPNGMKLEDEISVFVYTDSEDRIVATTIKPKIELHQFACLIVNQVNNIGAFLDWGLEKDLFVPFKEQKLKMREGNSYIVYMYNDEESDRLVASAKIFKYLSNEELTVKEGEAVNLLIAEPTDLGVNVIINNLHRGLIYRNEIFQNLELGDQIKGYIKKVRDDNRLDVSLQAQGLPNIEPSAAKVLGYLKMNQGFMTLTDKSRPEEIMAKMQMSKKSFKKALGSLYRQKLVRLEKNGTYLV
ncbi:MAG: S1 RNA-binding domain-containing protein [Saprospiraceae bacterium]